MHHNNLHIKVYDEFFNITEGRRARICEVLGTPNSEIAHINASGMGGRESAHVIENLMALHPELHKWTEGRYKDWLTKVHTHFMDRQTPWIEKHPQDPVLGEFLWECSDKLPKRWRF